MSNFNKYEERHRTNCEKNNTKNKIKSKKMVSVRMIEEYKTQIEDKDAQLEALKDQINGMEEYKTQMMSDIREVEMDLLAVIDEKDAELNANKDQMRVMGKYKTQMEDKDAQLKALKDQINEMGKYKKQMEDKNAQLEARAEEISETAEKDAELKECLVEEIEANIVHMKCTICKEIYKFPVILTCGHTFCMICLYTVMKIRYAKGKEINNCFLCQECFQLDGGVIRIVFAYSMIENLITSKEKICELGAPFLSDFYYDIGDCRENHKVGEHLWEEMHKEKGNFMLANWANEKASRPQAELTTVDNSVSNLSSNILQNHAEYFDQLNVKTRAVALESPENSYENYEDCDRREAGDDMSSYLLQKNVFPAHLFEKLVGTKGAILKKMKACTLNEVNEARAAFKKFKFITGDNIKLMFESHGSSSSRQKIFDSFLKYESDKNKSTGRDLNQTPRDLKRSIYSLKKSLRRNWYFLDLQPNFIIFDAHEEADGEKLMEHYSSKGKRAYSDVSESHHSQKSSSSGSSNAKKGTFTPACEISNSNASVKNKFVYYNAKHTRKIGAFESRCDVCNKGSEYFCTLRKRGFCSISCFSDNPYASSENRIDFQRLRYDEKGFFRGEWC